MSAEFLIDHSAWARMFDDSLPDSRAIEVAEDLEEHRLGVCLPFMLEAGYSALDSIDHAALINELEALPEFPIEEECERRALDAHARLAEIGHHRMAPVDIMIGAIADRYRVGVLHYDPDFDVLLEKTGLDFHSQWLMPRGSID